MYETNHHTLLESSKKYKPKVSVLHECERPYSAPIWLAIL